MSANCNVNTDENKFIGRVQAFDWSCMSITYVTFTEYESLIQKKKPGKASISYQIKTYTCWIVRTPLAKFPEKRAAALSAQRCSSFHQIVDIWQKGPAFSPSSG